MSIERELSKRSGSKCELCGAEENLKVYQVLPTKKGGIDEAVFACNTCIDQIENPDNVDLNHWRCLNDSMWNENIPVQVAAWRMLSRLRAAGWPQELLDMMYLDEDTLEWAKATGEGEDDENKLVHRDSNGVVLQHGDSVVLIKDLKVKGSSMVAKQGTAVRNIRLDHENAEYIEGKVDGQQIVIITQYVKKI
ncbi:PhnA domain-containing protein [Flavobacterium johnsoniae]|jgi:protein PhnA|uniref:PhnA protein-like protein n=1 Tax=Flavobacterium johnsoniae (strain ATCC 17061 / DSM 2064 / JCM 8514 / BCRC 14874 / CCUG 350202 / NBRC 14942 / NCIMB 11054 / UW101) TaxID=376686 RepID=A5FGN0_FLAJ1|nr:alkylphosphonate utilization protein [Flavobacterium johnsoniae]ABQ05642.1 PhnA protein-like protein [Flavobacterium johnsoniae UW101]OXG00087.1 PhnA protein [Flavobacterium johnsoniae UW101]WQG82554.1 PhnA domain-containing protein [Flavobacterium johnsoniae UW101]SHL51353.1 phosphonoacetate hydrolase [Flavobacterium johnsoniae]